jgi:hypothetical protein
MTDGVFDSGYLKVWVNVTYLGTTAPLLSGTTGATSVDWGVPDVSAPGSTVTVEVVNPFGLKGQASRTFTVAPATPYSAYVAVIIVIVIAVFILLAYRHARRQEGSPTPVTRPAETLGPPPPVAAPRTPTAQGTKVCPRCGTSVNEADETCFFCGLAFGKPPA